MPDEAEVRNAERKLRAAAWAGRMTVEVVARGDSKPSPYEFITPEERLAAAVRLIEDHQALRGGFSRIARRAWPREVVIAGEGLGETYSGLCGLVDRALRNQRGVPFGGSLQAW
jgi:hypothetical protein